MIIIPAGALASGANVLILAATLAALLVWKRARASVPIVKETLRVAGMMISGFIVFHSSESLVLLAILCTPVVLFVIEKSLRKAVALEWRPLNRLVCLWVLLAVVLGAKLHTSGLDIAFPHSTPPDTWTEVQHWAAERPRDAVFLVPPDTEGFRNFSERSIVGDHKDGAPGIIQKTRRRNGPAG